MTPTNSTHLPRLFAVAFAVSVCLVLAAIDWGVWRPDWGSVLAVSPARDLTGIVDLTRSFDQLTSGPVRLSVDGTSRTTSGGLVLGPGASLHIGTPTAADQIDLALFGVPPRVKLSVTLGDGDSHVLETGEQRADGSRVRYPLAPEKPGLWAAVSYSKSLKPGEAAPWLWQLRYTFADRRANRLPPVPLILATLLTTGFLLWLSFEHGRDERTQGIAGNGMQRGGRKGTDGGAAFRWAVRCAIILFGFLLSVSLRSWDLSRGQQAILLVLEAATLAGGAFVVRDGSVLRANGKDLNLVSGRVVWALAAILLIGFQARWGGYVDHRREPLLPDARGFLQITESGAWYATAAPEGPWVREPLWVWVNRVAGWIVGLNENSLRLVSLLAGLLAITQVARLGTRWFGAGVGLLAAAGFALSPRWIEWTALGLRTEFYTLLVLSFVLVWDRRGDRTGATAGQSVWLGVLGAAAQLTYISSLAWTIPLLVWRFWRNHWTRRSIVLCLVVAIVPLIPHLIFNYTFRNSHDFMFSSNVHARFYRNYEKYGLPGSPNRAKFEKAPYGGPPITTMGYLLGRHGIGQLAAGSARGAFNIYLYREPGIEQFGASKALTLLYALGVIVALFSRAGRRSLAVWIWLGLPFLFLASLPGFPTRLLAPLTPWMWFYLALGGVKVVGLGRVLLPWDAHASRGKG